MADTRTKATIECRITFTVNESEARALDALVGYGDDAFLKCFYEHMGKTFMRPNEGGLRSFFASVRREISPYLSRIDRARHMFYDEGGR